MKRYPIYTVRDVINPSAPNTTGLTDSFNIGIKANDSNIVPGDNVTFALSLTQSDTNAGQTETVQLAFPSPDFQDSNISPTETRLFVVRSWASGCVANTTNLTTASNANNSNDGITCNVKTNNAIGDLSNPVTLTTGSMNFPGGNVTSSLIRIWFQIPADLVGDTVTITATSSGAYSATLFTATGVGSAVNNLNGNFTFNTSALTNLQLTNLVLTVSYTALVVAVPVTSVNIDAWAIDATIKL